MGFLKGAMTKMLKEWSKKKEFYARKPKVADSLSQSNNVFLQSLKLKANNKNYQKSKKTGRRYKDPRLFQRGHDENVERMKQTKEFYARKPNGGKQSQSFVVTLSHFMFGNKYHILQILICKGRYP